MPVKIYWKVILFPQAERQFKVKRRKTMSYGVFCIILYQRNSLNEVFTVLRFSGSLY